MKIFCKFSPSGKSQRLSFVLPPHPKRTKFWLMIGYANVNFLLISLVPWKDKQSFDDSSHFTTDKFLKNFNPRPKKFSSSYYNVHFFFHKQISNQKIFCFHTKRTFFSEWTPPDCKISINGVIYPSLTIQRTFFSQKSGYILKKFAQNAKFLRLAQIARNWRQLCCAIFSDFFHFRNTWNVEKATDVNKIWI